MFFFSVCVCVCELQRHNKSNVNQISEIACNVNYIVNYTLSSFILSRRRLRVLVLFITQIICTRYITHKVSFPRGESFIRFVFTHEFTRSEESHGKLRTVTPTCAIELKHRSSHPPAARQKITAA